MKVLVTGGYGFIGYHLAERLAKDGHDVWIIDNCSKDQDTEKADIMFKCLLDDYSIKYMPIDLTREYSVIGNFLKSNREFDITYHLAAINGTANFYNKAHEVISNNFLSTMNILNYIRTKKFIFTSSCEAYASSINDNNIPTKEDIALSIADVNNPRWSYGGSKILEELYVKNYCTQKDIDYIILRYHNIYGIRDCNLHVIPALINRIMNAKNDILDIYGDCTRSFLYIKDCVEYTINLCKKGHNDIFNVGIQKETSISELAINLLSILDKNMNIKVHNAPIGSVSRRCPDMTKTINKTNYIPKYDLTSGLKEMIDEYKRVGFVY